MFFSDKLFYFGTMIEKLLSFFNMDNLKFIFNWLKKQPLWLRLVLICTVAISCAVLTFSSCAPVVKVSARSTTDSVSISVAQNVTDSTGVTVNVNPNINLN